MRMFNPAALAIAAFLLGLASASARDDGSRSVSKPLDSRRRLGSWDERAAAAGNTLLAASDDDD